MFKYYGNLEISKIEFFHFSKTERVFFLAVIATFYSDTAVSYYIVIIIIILFFVNFHVTITI